jgi:hypothetical protein
MDWCTPPPPVPTVGRGASQMVMNGTIYRSLPYLGTHLDTPSFRAQHRCPGKGLLYNGQLLSLPSVEAHEAFMGSNVGDTVAPGLNRRQRNQLLRQCTKINIISWVISQIPPGGGWDITCPNVSPEQPTMPTAFTCSQSLPSLGVLPSLLPAHATKSVTLVQRDPPTPLQKRPRFIPDI